ncbi:MAG TPA: DUF5069 domain-containing protein [Candidatus Manganitrophaceae bacterium]|nr:DUF5069 domain-containing protein [Candidatus Manganitrophaceae bacterium]
MDLTTSYPRSPRQELGGFAHLARMIDKAKASRAGKLGEYIYPCPLDRRLLDFLEITPERFSEAIDKKKDEEIVEWVRKEMRPRSKEEIAAWNKSFLSQSPDNDEKWAYFKKLRDSIDPSRTDITTWPDLLDLDEKRSVPLRKAG